MLAENQSHAGPKGSKDDQGATCSASLNNEEKHGVPKNTAGY